MAVQQAPGIMRIDLRRCDELGAPPYKRWPRGELRRPGLDRTCVHGGDGVRERHSLS